MIESRETATYPWKRRQIGQDQYVDLKDAEAAVDQLRSQLQSALFQGEAFERSARNLATRAVVAEAKATEMELVVAPLTAEITRLSETLRVQYHNYRNLWATMWIRLGFDKERVTKALVDSFQISITVAQQIVTNQGCYTFDVDHNSTDDFKRWGKK